MLLDDGHCLRDHTLQACRLRNVNKVNPFSASSLPTMIQLVDNGLGITFLPALALEAGVLRRTRVKTAPI